MKHWAINSSLRNSFWTSSRVKSSSRNSVHRVGPTNSVKRQSTSMDLPDFTLCTSSLRVAYTAGRCRATGCPATRKYPSNSPWCKWVYLASVVSVNHFNTIGNSRSLKQSRAAPEPMWSITSLIDHPLVNSTVISYDLAHFLCLVAFAARVWNCSTGRTPTEKDSTTAPANMAIQRQDQRIRHSLSRRCKILVSWFLKYSCFCFKKSYHQFLRSATKIVFMAFYKTSLHSC